MRKDSGFTLIELMVTISVAAILMTVGIPSMLDLIKTNRRAAAANSLVAEIQRARGTAASRGLAMMLCHSTDAANCSGQSSPDWAKGWILFIDDNQDATADATDNNGAKDAGEEVISVSRARDGVTMPSNRSEFRFSSGFQSSGTIAGTLAVCVEKDNANARWIVVSTLGRPRLKDTYGAGDPDCTSLGP